MKKICILALMIWAPVVLFAQTDDAIKWSFSAAKAGDGSYELHLTATLGEGWHTYSQDTPSGGPAPTEISFNVNPLLSLQGATREAGKLNKHFEPLFGVQVMQYSNRVDFVQKVVLKHMIKTTVTGKIRFMVCNDHECLPPTVKDFSLPLPQ